MRCAGTAGHQPPPSPLATREYRQCARAACCQKGCHCARLPAASHPAPTPQHVRTAQPPTRLQLVVAQCAQHALCHGRAAARLLGEHGVRVRAHDFVAVAPRGIEPRLSTFVMACGPPARPHACMYTVPYITWVLAVREPVCTYSYVCGVSPRSPPPTDPEIVKIGSLASEQVDRRLEPHGAVDLIASREEEASRQASKRHSTWCNPN